MRRFQGLCLLELEGWRTINIYDRLPSCVRQRLRDSPYNLCAACVAKGSNGSLPSMLAMIEQMEAIVACNQVRRR